MNDKILVLILLLQITTLYNMDDDKGLFRAINPRVLDGANYYAPRITRLPTPPAAEIAEEDTGSCCCTVS